MTTAALPRNVVSSIPVEAPAADRLGDVSDGVLEALLDAAALLAEVSEEEGARPVRPAPAGSSIAHNPRMES